MSCFLGEGARALQDLGFSHDLGTKLAAGGSQLGWSPLHGTCRVPKAPLQGGPWVLRDGGCLNHAGRGGVRGKHRLLLPPEGALVVTAPGAASPRAPGLSHRLPAPGPELSFCSPTRKSPRIGPSPSVSGTRGALEAAEKRMSLLNFHGNTRERLHPWRKLPERHPEALPRGERLGTGTGGPGHCRAPRLPRGISLHKN